MVWLFLFRNRGLSLVILTLFVLNHTNVVGLLLLVPIGLVSINLLIASVWLTLVLRTTLSPRIMDVLVKRIFTNDGLGLS